MAPITVDAIPHLKSLQVPGDLYKCARAAKHKRAGRENGQEMDQVVEDLGAAEFVFDARSMVAESVHIYASGNRVTHSSTAPTSNSNNSSSIEHNAQAKPGPLSPSPPYEMKSYTQSPPIERSPIPHSPYPMYHSPSRHDDRPCQQSQDTYSLRPINTSQDYYTPGVSTSLIPHPIIHFGSKAQRTPDHEPIEPHTTHFLSSTTNYPRLPPIQVLEQGIPSLRPLNPRCAEDHKALSKLQYGW